MIKFTDTEDIKSRAFCNPYDSGEYVSPTPEEIRAVRVFFNMTQIRVAQVLAVSWSAHRGSSTVSKWETQTGSKDHRAITYCAWRLFLSHLGLVDSLGCRPEELKKNATKIKKFNAKPCNQ